MKVLICVFACLRDPDIKFGFGKGGESGLGWNIILQIKKFAEIFILTDSGNREAIEKKIAEDKISGINFYYISLPKYLNFTKKIIQIYTYLWQIKAYFIARKLHKQNEFDLFHHITYANDWMASHTGALLPVPYIRGPGGGAHKVPKTFVKEYSFKQKISEKVRSAGQWIFKHDPFFIMGQNKAKAILVCNKEAFNALPKKWQQKAYYFPVNGISKIELDLFEKEKISDNKFKILSAGKLLKIKSFDLAIKSFANFAKDKNNCELKIIGDGPEFLNLENLSKELKIFKKVKFEKWMPREKLLEQMIDCDVFLFCSLRDGGGQVVVEAMAAGKPVVCFDIAGPGFHIDKNCGIKINPKNSEQSICDISNALEKLYKDENLRIKLGVTAKKKIEENYDWDKLGDKLQKIYKEKI